MYKGRYICLKLVTIIFYPAHRELRVEVPVRGNLYFCPDLNRKMKEKRTKKCSRLQITRISGSVTSSARPLSEASYRSMWQRLTLCRLRQKNRSHLKRLLKRILLETAGRNGAELKRNGKRTNRSLSNVPCFPVFFQAGTASITIQKTRRLLQKRNTTTTVDFWTIWMRQPFSFRKEAGMTGKDCLCKDGRSPENPEQISAAHRRGWNRGDLSVCGTRRHGRL